MDSDDAGVFKTFLVCVTILLVVATVGGFLYSSKTQTELTNRIHSMQSNCKQVSVSQDHDGEITNYECKDGQK